MKNSQNSGDRRFGRPGGWQQASVPDASDASDWFAGRLPDDWFTGTADVQVDREEIVVIGELPAVDGGEAAADGRISRFRETTRADRMAHRRRGRGSLRAQGRLGCTSGRKDRPVHTSRSSGDDTTTSARTQGSRHSGGRGCCSFASGRPHVDSPVGGQAQRTMAHRTPRSDVEGRRPPIRGSENLTARKSEHRTLTRPTAQNNSIARDRSSVLTWNTNHSRQNRKRAVAPLEVHHAKALAPISTC